MIKRYHKNVFYPENSLEIIRVFILELMNKRLSFSDHALHKYKRMNRRIKSHIKNILRSTIPLGNINEDNIFEIYINNSNKITKGGIRFPIPDTNITIILIVSTSGKIVTVYVNNTNDSHESLDSSKYEKGKFTDEN